VVERSRSQRLAAEEQWEWRFNYCTVNAGRSPSEMQTTLCYCDIIIPTNTKVHQQRYCIYSLACHYRWPGMVDSRKTHQVCVYLGLSVKIWVFGWVYTRYSHKLSLAALDLASLHWPLRFLLVGLIIFYKCGKWFAHLFNSHGNQPQWRTIIF